jgi:sulfate-transporting ATPase
MVSFPVTLAAALLIGVVESEVSWYVSTPGWAAASPFLIIIVVLALRGQTIPGRAQERAKLPAVGRGHISIPAVVSALVLSMLWLAVAPEDWVNGTGVTVGFGIMLLSFVVVTGYAGQLSLAQFALAGMGAFVAGRLAATQGWPFLVVLVCGVLAAVPVGVVVGLPAVRTRGTQLAVATLGLAVAIEGLVFNNYHWTGGGDGTSVPLPEVFGIPVDAIFHPRAYVIVSIAIFTVIALGVANLRRSRTGRRLLATRANERAALSLGVNIVSAKLYAFVVGSMIAAAGGIVLAFRSSSILYADYTAFGSITLIGNAVVGGIGFIAGPLFGATLEPASLGTNIGFLVFGDGFQKYLPLLTGIILVLIVTKSPDGMASHSAHQVRQLGHLVGRLLRLPKRQGRRAAAGVWAREPAASKRSIEQRTSLAVEDVTVTFGAVKALESVALQITAGRVLGLIGPNGAGKTTLIDAVTGFNRPSSGDVRIDGKSVLRLSPRRRAELGLSRSFQALELFEDMTVLENLLVATERQRFFQYATDVVFPRKPRLSQAARDAVAEFALEDDLDRLPSDLPYGKRRLVAIARAIAAEPDFLLLDEPAAGLSDGERVELVELIRALASRGIGVLLVEHDVELVMRACDDIVVLDFGRVIARGEPAEIRRDPAVIAAYLGEPVDDVAAAPSDSPDEMTKAEVLS